MLSIGTEDVERIRSYLYLWAGRRGIGQDVADMGLSEALSWADRKELPQEDKQQSRILFAAAKTVCYRLHIHDKKYEELTEENGPTSPPHEETLMGREVYQSALSLFSPAYRYVMMSAPYEIAVGTPGWMQQMADLHDLSKSAAYKELQRFRLRLRKALSLPPDAPWSEIRNALWTRESPLKEKK